jgi:hypothetical protein
MENCQLPSPELPFPMQALQAAMREHLQLAYQSEQTSDEQVLSIYPSAIRRKVCMGFMVLGYRIGQPDGQWAYVPDWVHDAWPSVAAQAQHRDCVGLLWLAPRPVACFGSTPCCLLWLQVVRHLYAPSVKAAALFRGCSPLFLDALLATTHVELYMPAVQPGA